MTNSVPSLAGSSWFFSALLFCYALTPLTSWCLDELSERVHNVYGCVGLALLITYQLMVSACKLGIFYESPYYCPAVRFLEYACAYSFGCALAQTPYVDNPVGGTKATALQFVAFGAYSVFALPRSLHLPESVYTLLSLGLVVALICARGVMSKVLEARALLWLSQFQTDAFISHQNIIWWIGYFIPGLRFRYLVPLDLTGIALFVTAKKVGQRVYSLLRSDSGQA